MRTVRDLKEWLNLIQDDLCVIMDDFGLQVSSEDYSVCGYWSDTGTFPDQLPCQRPQKVSE